MRIRDGQTKKNEPEITLMKREGINGTYKKNTTQKENSEEWKQNTKHHRS